MLLWLFVMLQTFLCAWINGERVRIRRRGGHQRFRWWHIPAHRGYVLLMRPLARSGRARQQRDPGCSPSRDALRRRMNWITVSIMTAAMVPLLGTALLHGRGLAPVAGPVLSWGLVWCSPLLTAAPARMVAICIAVWRGWVRIDDGREGDGDDPAPVPSRTPDGSHEFPLAA